MEIQPKRKNFALILVTYLLGIFMGAIDTGILSPARTVIQNDLGVDEKSGIWMITIYTLAFATSIPIMGKLADKFGRKVIYIVSILLFGLGSLFCGLSQEFGGFGLLLAARAVQAIGGGGIIPVATSEFGTSFPKEKRGLALGLVGGVFAVANIFGASAGSAILDLFGTGNWQIIFYVNLPITVFILLAGFFILPNTKMLHVKRIDFAGIGILTVMILSLLNGLRGIDFFNFTATLGRLDVFPFLILFALLLPFFIIAEKRAADPVINLNYFKNPRILTTLAISFVSGFVLIGLIFVPQFAENAMRLSSGSGGYFVLITGLFAGISSPLSGRLVDKMGVKPVLAFGFASAAVGALFLVAVATAAPVFLTVFISLMFIGTGIGFTMGSPMNYMMLDNTPPEESNSALATMTLVRSIGTAIAPAIMIGFLAHAGMAAQVDLIKMMPGQLDVPQLPYEEELNAAFNQLKTDPITATRFATISLPDLATMHSYPINLSGGSDVVLPGETIALLQSSDVTTVADNTRQMADMLFTLMLPKAIGGIESGIDQSIDGMTAALGEMPDTQDFAATRVHLADLLTKMTAMKAGVPDAMAAAQEDYLIKIDERGGDLETTFQSVLNTGFQQVYLTVVAAALLALLILAFYRRKK